MTIWGRYLNNENSIETKFPGQWFIQRSFVEGNWQHKFNAYIEKNNIWYTSILKHFLIENLIQNAALSCGQSYKTFTLVNYDPRVVI